MAVVNLLPLLYYKPKGHRYNLLELPCAAVRRSAATLVAPVLALMCERPGKVIPSHFSVSPPEDGVTSLMEAEQLQRNARKV